MVVVVGVGGLEGPRNYWVVVGYWRDHGTTRFPYSCSSTISFLCQVHFIDQTRACVSRPPIDIEPQDSPTMAQIDLDDYTWPTNVLRMG